MAQREYIIFTDTNADLPEQYVKENGLGILALSVTIDGVFYNQIDEVIDPREFYAKMRAGIPAKTMQVNPDQAEKAFEQWLEKGYDVLYIAFSSGLSGSYNSAVIAAQELAPRFPEQKILVVDTLAASLGQGLLVYHAVELKKQGKTIDELVKWLEENRLHLCHLFTVDDLNHLYRGGRVSKTTAFVGTVLNIKPTLHVDDAGKLIPVGKVRGRKQSLNALVDMMTKQIGHFENKIFFISHGDCIEDAEYVAALVRERLHIQESLINYVGPTIGAHSGPGTVALFFLGEKR
ncbi:MAG: DegV family protein [Oscillospiraceae bacterium]|nr:DegV family protein [Oscillospiraceae bacterium]